MGIELPAVNLIPLNLDMKFPFICKWDKAEMSAEAELQRSRPWGQTPPRLTPRV